MSDDELRPIVVGVDGSAAAKAALRWAVDQARVLECPVDVVSAWHVDYAVMMGPMPVASVPDPAGVEAAQRAVLDEATAGVDVRRVLAEGDAGDLLVKMSRDARMLVVGNRGRNPLAELLLGSVSSYCVHHATCPVVVVRAAEQTTPATTP
ncbi:universal stress protein [Lentzea sp. NBRC 102530]|uniref:universal stress protein n=1 Tax=Lentzea sp. NBRC 102530 TaxID=3032201 RepID=UPI0024A187D2|nr:universal stress protein [Lentzea sp. NBRC 102530]GLY49828.1 universal stress protein [Lentzea sp. NBRC 102530]